MDQIHTLRNSSDTRPLKESIFGGILTSKLPAEEKSDYRMANEAQLVVIAGEGTTGSHVFFCGLDPRLSTDAPASQHGVFTPHYLKSSATQTSLRS
jgi:hypothetical protein